MWNFGSAAVLVGLGALLGGKISSWSPQLPALRSR